MGLRNIPSFQNYGQKCLKIESKFRGFWPMQKLGENWAKFSQCIIEFDLGPNMWYNFYDALLGSLRDLRWVFSKVYAKKGLQQNPRQLRILTYIGRPNNVVKEFWQKAASHVVLLVTKDWRILFAAYTTAETANVFNEQDNPQNCPFSWRNLDPNPTHGALDLHKSTHKWHLNWFSQFCTVHPWNQHTDRHIDNATCYICSNRPHLMHWVHAMQPNNNDNKDSANVDTQWYQTYRLMLLTAIWTSPKPIKFMSKHDVVSRFTEIVITERIPVGNASRQRTFWRTEQTAAAISSHTLIWYQRYVTYLSLVKKLNSIMKTFQQIISVH